MFDHVDIHVRDLEAAKAFYTIVLAPLGFRLTAATDEYVEFGALSIGRRMPPTPPIHFAFLARSREAVDAFHATGVAAGFRSNGAPALREYAPDYYASYLLDPDSHNVEAVYREPETRANWDWLRWQP